MGNLNQRTEDRSVKMLLIGDSGSGKTGACFALAKYFELVYMDFDSGGDVVYELAKREPELGANINFVSFTDKFRMVGGMTIPEATAYTRAMNFLDTGKAQGVELGPLHTWTKKRILILDSFTHMGNAAMRRVLALNGRLGKNPQIQDWGQGMGDCENLLATLYSDEVKCHVIVIAHFTYDKNETTGEIKGLPTAPGQKLSPKVPSYFNTMVQTKTIGKSRRLLTQPQGIVDLKVPVLSGLASDYPAETGLVDLFKALGEIK